MAEAVFAEDVRHAFPNTIRFQKSNDLAGRELETDVLNGRNAPETS
jgi:hypothetical protein